MAAPSQRDIINDMQGRLIGQGKDIEYLKKQGDTTAGKLDVVIDTMGKLAFVPVRDFEDYRRGEATYKRAMDNRVKALEDYNSKNSLGIRFSNDIVGNLLKFVTLAAAAALLIAAAKYVSSGGFR